jgi:hypothetical protein
MARLKAKEAESAAEAFKKLAEEEAKRAEEEASLKVEAEAKATAEVAKKLADEEAQRADEQARLRVEAEAKAADEEANKRAEEEAKQADKVTRLKAEEVKAAEEAAMKLSEDGAKRVEEQVRVKVEAEAKAKAAAEEAKKLAEEEAKRAKVQARLKVEAEAKAAEEEAKKLAGDETKPAELPYSSPLPLQRLDYDQEYTRLKAKVEAKAAAKAAKKLAREEAKGAEEQARLQVEAKAKTAAEAAKKVAEEESKGAEEQARDKYENAARARGAVDAYAVGKEKGEVDSTEEAVQTRGTVDTGASTPRTSGTPQGHESTDSWIEEVIDFDEEYIEETLEYSRDDLVMDEEIFEEAIDDEDNHSTASKNPLSAAEKELDEIRALDLTEAFSKRDVASSEEDIKEIKKPVGKSISPFVSGRKIAFSTDDKIADKDEKVQVAASAQPLSAAEKELQEIRALGLTKSAPWEGTPSEEDGKGKRELRANVVSPNSAGRKMALLNSDSTATKLEKERATTPQPLLSASEKELQEIRALGLTKGVTKREAANPIDGKKQAKDPESKLVLRVPSGKENAVLEDNTSTTKDKKEVESGQSLSSAEREFQEVRALELAKKISRMKEAGSQDGKEEAKDTVGKIASSPVGGRKKAELEDYADKPETTQVASASHRKLPPAEKELQEVRALGLTKVVSTKEITYQEEDNNGKQYPTDKVVLRSAALSTPTAQEDSRNSTRPASFKIASLKSRKQADDSSSKSAPLPAGKKYQDARAQMASPSPLQSVANNRGDNTGGKAETDSVDISKLSVKERMQYFNRGKAKADSIDISKLSVKERMQFFNKGKPESKAPWEAPEESPPRNLKAPTEPVVTRPSTTTRKVSKDAENKNLTSFQESDSTKAGAAAAESRRKAGEAISKHVEEHGGARKKAVIQDYTAATNESPNNTSKRSAEKELEELRALGLTKALSRTPNKASAPQPKRLQAIPAKGSSEDESTTRSVLTRNDIRAEMERIKREMERIQLALVEAKEGKRGGLVESAAPAGIPVKSAAPPGNPAIEHAPSPNDPPKTTSTSNKAVASAIPPRKPVESVTPPDKPVERAAPPENPVENYSPAGKPIESTIPPAKQVEIYTLANAGTPESDVAGVLDTSAVAIESDEEIEVYEADGSSYLIAEEFLEESWLSAIPEDHFQAALLDDSKKSLNGLVDRHEVEEAPAAGEGKENAFSITTSTAVATQVHLEPHNAEPSQEPTGSDTKSSQPPTEAVATPSQHDDGAKSVDTIDKTLPAILPANPSFDEGGNPTPSQATLLDDSKRSLNSLGDGHEVEKAPAGEVKENAAEPRNADPSQKPTGSDAKSSQPPTEAVATPSQHDDGAKAVETVEKTLPVISPAYPSFDEGGNPTPSQATLLDDSKRSLNSLGDGHEVENAPAGEVKENAAGITLNTAAATQAHLEPHNADPSQEPTGSDSKSFQPPAIAAATPSQHDDGAKSVETVEKARPFILPASPSFDEGDNPTHAADKGATSIDVEPENAPIKRPSLRLPSPPSFNGLQETKSDEEKESSPRNAEAAADLKSAPVSPKKDAVGSPDNTESDKGNKKKKGKLKQFGRFIFGRKKKE